MIRQNLIWTRVNLPDAPMFQQSGYAEDTGRDIAKTDVRTCGGEKWVDYRNCSLLWKHLLFFWYGMRVWLVLLSIGSAFVVSLDKFNNYFTSKKVYRNYLCRQHSNNN